MVLTERARSLNRALPTGKSGLNGASLKKRRLSPANENEANVSSDSLDSSQQLPPAKKTRVVFDPKVVVRYQAGNGISTRPPNPLGLTSNPGGISSLESVRLEVKHAIRGRLDGDDEGFDLLRRTIDGLSDDLTVSTSTAVLSRYLIALAENAPLLNHRCSALVTAVLGIPWIGKDDKFVSLYVQFLGSLLSAQVGYCRPVFRMILGLFRYLPPSSSNIRLSAIHRPELRNRMHKTMQYLLKLVPTSSIVLASIIDSCYPRPPDPIKCYTDYCSNLLRLATYSPELKNEIMVVLLSQVVKVDVRIQVNMEDLEDDLAEALVDKLDGSVATSADDADMSGDELDDSDSDSDSDNEEDAINTARLRKLKNEVEQMDGVLNVLFSFYHQLFESGSDVERNDSFDNLLNQFTVSLLPSYRSRHTQFLLFHLSQTRPEYIDKFAGTCIQQMFDRTKSPLIQLTASSYLSSFISRGSRVSAQTIGEVFYILLEQADTFREKQEAICSGPDLRRYSNYYCTLQSLLYIFCFRWRELVTDEDIEQNFWDYADSGKDLPWLPDIKDSLSKNIFSVFNPLKVCNQEIVNQFATVASRLRFLFVHSLLDANKRVRLSHMAKASSAATTSARSGQPAKHAGENYQERQTALSQKREDSSFQLDAYFPFDPYRLPKSKRWLDGDYVEWKGVPGHDEEEDDEEDEEEEEEEPVRQQISIPTNGNYGGYNSDTDLDVDEYRPEDLDCDEYVPGY